MAVRTRIEPIDRQIMLAIRDGEGPEERSKALADFARQNLAEAQEVNRQATGHVPTHDTFVDGVEGAALEQVKPDGVIVFEFHLLGDVFEWIAAQLLEHSPMKTGRYSESHLFFADGVEVLPGETPPDAAEYVFINSQPYARKIERGQSPQQPDGVYEAVAALAQSRFGNVARVLFGWRSLPSGAIGDWAATTKMEAPRPYLKRSPKAFQDWLTRQPAIIIKTGAR
ncbi:hypothetical protein KHC28_00400 [Ancylobacter sonchi]|uniref:hypothetical protein n=1 Tax=Ancylobacter sonchi TaxID=1937790 RepID=UPI001BD38CB7|nr:hypothetical protein [Ancylobacter sonchi]MBS7532125.1 hypothetical protein [Ancylobacter sonchi]